MHGMKRSISNIQFLATLVMVAIILSSSRLYAKTINDLPAVIEKATGGNADSQSDLVDFYFNNERNYQEATKWCNALLNNNSAKDSGKEFAYRILGLCAMYGHGREKSIPAAIELFKKGAKYNKKYSCSILGDIYAKELKDSVQSIKWYKLAAEDGNKGVANFLGRLFENGYESKSNTTKIYWPGITRDISEACHFYMIYIKSMGYWTDCPANANLLYKLGSWYFKGESNLSQNYDRAYNLFNEALEMNEISEESKKLTQEEEGDILWNLSICYRFGRGVEKDELIARRYVKKAAEKGNKDAISLLAQ